MRRSIFSTPIRRFVGLAALTLGLMLAPAVLPSGGDNAEARTKKQCTDRFIGCSNRCAKAAEQKHGGSATKKAGTPAAIESANCAQRTCDPQLKSCAANASDTKKPTKAVAEPAGAGPKTKVQPKAQPGKVSVPVTAVPATRAPPRVQTKGK